MDIIQVSNPADRKKIKAQIDDAVALKIHIKDYQNSIKDIVDLINTDFGIDKKHIRAMIKMRFNRNKQEVVASTEAVADFYDNVFTDEDPDSVINNVDKDSIVGSVFSDED